MMLTSQKFCFCNRQSFTIKFFLTILALLVAQHVLAQVTESFSDGDFTNAPAWSGNQSSFVVENGELRLKAEASAGSSFLVTSSNAIQDASWECVVRLSFNPSSSNRTQIYLVSNAQDLTMPLNGYYVMIGDTPDEISLYRQSGTTKTKIIDGANGRVNLTTVLVKVRVVRDNAGNWELFSDVDLSGTLTSEGTTVDTTYTQASWFGILCAYTATRSDDFYFDDMTVKGSPVRDNTPPELEAVNVLSSQSVELKFSEPLDVSTAQIVTNYILSPGSWVPSTVTPGSEAKTVVLTFDQHFSNASESVLSISRLKDVAGNEMIATQKTLFYFQPIASIYKDVIITEIFCDPEPSVGLPKVEFIELFNRSEKVFDLSGWSITDGSTAGVFPKMYLFPGEYVILAPSGESAEFGMLGKTMEITSFPSLNNSSDVLLFKNPDGLVIDAVHYSETWYRDDAKQQGGWSLELIDPHNTCSAEDNWTASEDPGGGTPGRQNSVIANNPDLIGPMILSVIPVSPTELLVRFNEKLANVPLSNQQFVIHPNIEVAEVNFADTLLRSAIILVRQAFDLSTTYSLSASEVYDCSGNIIHNEGNTMLFGVPQEAEQNDLVINEILFNPLPSGVDFVEVYNPSSKFINLRSLTIVNSDNDKASLSTEDRLLAPQQYVVITTNADAIIGQYPSSFESSFCILSPMPSMNDDEGMIKIISEAVLIDSFGYAKTMHSPFLKDDEGVSLERISFAGETNSAANWKSANSAAGFATPGFVNSNSTIETAADSDITIQPEAFSPQESPNDFALIHYNFNSGNWVANVGIVDSYGREICKIANNELLGTSGFFRWDGNRSDGTKARVGYYYVRFEIFDATGVVKLFRKRVAIASRF